MIAALCSIVQSYDCGSVFDLMHLDELFVDATIGIEIKVIDGQERHNVVDNQRINEQDTDHALFRITIMWRGVWQQ